MSRRLRMIKTHSQACGGHPSGVPKSFPRSPSQLSGRPRVRGAVLSTLAKLFRRAVRQLMVCTGAAVLAIALSLLALSAVVLAASVGDFGGLMPPSEHPLRIAVQDGAVLFYLAQLVSVSFFHHTAGLRFAALPGLALVALAIFGSAMAATRLIGGSARRRLLVAMLMPIPYAVLVGLGACYLPLRLAGPVIGSATPVSPAGGEAFLLPLAWGLLFAPLGGLVGVSGRSWRRDAARLLGAWTTPARSSLRALAVGLALTSLVVVVSGAVLIGQSSEARSFASGDPGHVLTVAAGALIALPTLILTLFLACFGVSFDWRVEALSRTQGSGSILGGTLPTTGTAAHQMPGLLGLLLAIAAVTVVSAGWLAAAQHSNGDVRLSIANALRAGVLMTLACWLLALFARVDAQAGGLLGLHIEADVASLLWYVPLWCLLGSAAGGLTYLASRGTAARGELAAALRGAALPSPEALTRAHLGSGLAIDSGWRDWWRQGLTSHAALGVSILTLPAMLIGIGPSGTSVLAGSATASLAPISQAAEQSLRADTVRGSRMSVVVDPSTRVVDSARVHLPVTALGVSPEQSPATKAKAVLIHYGNLFGMSERPGELSPAQVVIERAAKFDHRSSIHVYFRQMIDGIPVYGNSIGVHFAPGGKEVRFVDGSFIPEVTLADDRATISSDRAIALAKAALPGGELVHPPRLEVYAGPPSHPFGPAAHLAWFVWLSTGPLKTSKEYVVDADTGSILNVSNMGFHLEQEHVEIYNTEEKEPLLGKLVWKEGDPEPKDEDTKYADEYLKKAWKFFDEGFRGASCEGFSCGQIKVATIATVHYRPSFTYEWNPKYHEIVFGNGWPKALDIVGHEFAGGISEYKDPQEKMEGETGALVEGWADAMGKGLEGWVGESGGKWAEPKWKIGYKATPEEKGIRNLEKPKEDEEIKGDPDPEKLSEYRTVCQDNGDMHENSTIIGHAFYLLSKKAGIQDATEIFWKMQVANLAGMKEVKLESARGAAITAAEELFESEEAAQVKDTREAFNEVGLDGHTEPPKIECPICPPSMALAKQTPVNGTTPTLGMLATLYRARGKLAQPSASGHYFMPLYEGHIGRITELVSLDPTLEEMTVDGLRQIEPALNALAEGNGQKFKLSAPEMAQIEAALKRLAQDDRIFSGGGGLAKLIEHELRWLRLPTYAGMTYAAGFKRLNAATAEHIQSSPPPTTEYLVDPNCEKPYSNPFQVNNFGVTTPGHYKPGEVSPLDASGVACGTKIPLTGTGCSEEGAKTLNTEFTLKFPPGDKVNSTKEMKEGAFLGWTTGHVVGCAGSLSEIVSGREKVQAVKSWTKEQCPEEKSVISCYKMEGTFTKKVGSEESKFEGIAYAYVKEETSGRLILTSEPYRLFENGKETNIAGFTEFGIKLCPHAGEPGTETCGSHAEPWVHKNGEEGQPGCPTENEDGRYVLTVKNKAKEETSSEACVYWGESMHKQTVDSGNSLNAVSCIPATTDCVTVDGKGAAFYATNVSATAAATWTSWSGPTGASPGEAVACPLTSRCVLADGKAEKGGGNMYYATSLGGAWSEAFKPSNGALAISCPSSSFCVDSQESGRIRYSTNPASTSWTEVTIGSGSLSSVFCLSSSFCAVVNGSGDLYVANTEAKIKEESGWKKTDVDGSAALHGVACISTTSCVAVDGEGDIVDLTINGSGEATSAKHDLDGANDLTAITCAAEHTCVAVDAKGNVLVSTDGGRVWGIQHALGTDLTSVSCAKVTLCVAADTAGNVTAFTPFPAPSNHIQTVDSGNSLNAVSCVPGAVECVLTDSKGNAFYSTNVGTTAAATWTSWSGPTGASPSEAVACPSSTLCVLADGKAEKGGGGNLYYATSLGGAWKEAFAPVWGVDAISCPSSSFCLAGQAEGFIHYSTSPASSEWKTVSIAASAINAVDCLSASFCAVVDNTGHVRVANTEAKIKEEKGWKSTDIDGTSALHGVACTATTWCVTVDGEGHVLDLMINSNGEATVASKEDRDGTNGLTADTCTGETCVATDSKGNVLASANEGETWGNQYAFGADLTGVSCSGSTLCVVPDTAGEVTAFEPE